MAKTKVKEQKAIRNVYIEGVDAELWQSARMRGLKENKPMREVENEALRTYLNFLEEASTWARENGWSEPR